MKLTFIIDRNYLIAHTLSCSDSTHISSGRYKDDITDVQDAALPHAAYPALRDSPERLFYEPVDEGAWDLFREIKRRQAYRRLLEQTQKSKSELEAQWEANFERSLKIMQDVTGLDFEGEQFTAYVTHPSLRNGCYLGKRRFAAPTRAAESDSENYETVHIWHEILHDKLGNDDIGHAIIELAADNELRARLNGESYPPLVGHDSLKDVREQMLPDWIMCTASKGTNILEFERRMRRKRKPDEE